MFVLRQVNSKITTTYLSMTIICIMLLVSIGVLACGAGVTFTTSAIAKETTKFDMTVDQTNNKMLNNDRSNQPKDVLNILKKYNLWNEQDIKAYKDTILYTGNTTYSEVLKECSEEDFASITQEIDLDGVRKTPILLMKLSDYNDMVSLYGGDKIELEDDETAILANYEQIVDIYNKFIEKNGMIKIDNKEYNVKKDVVENQTYNYVIKSEVGVLIVNDDVIDSSYKIGFRVLNVMFNGNAESMAEDFYNKYYNTKIKLNKDDEIYDLLVNTREKTYAQTQGISLLCCYLAIYIGIVFIITSAAVLALQQLSESSDNKERYRLLKKIGADEKLIKGAIFKQVLIAFLAPLSLAIVHAIVGIHEANKIIAIFGAGSSKFGVITAAIVIVLIYGGYMMTTYFGCRRMANIEDK